MHSFFYAKQCSVSHIIQFIAQEMGKSVNDQGEIYFKFYL